MVFEPKPNNINVVFLCSIWHRSKGKKGQGHGGGRTRRKSYGAGGGGGGAGKAGKDAKRKHYGGAGGDGIAVDITGETVWYAGGGGGGVNKNGNRNVKNGGGLGGRGGGGRGSNFASTVKRGGGIFTGRDGKDNTGGGGGGTDPESRVAGDGGSGLVVVRYQSPMPLMVGGSISFKNGYQIHTFRNVGKTKLEYNPGHGGTTQNKPSCFQKCQNRYILLGSQPPMD